MLIGKLNLLKFIVNDSTCKLIEHIICIHLKILTILYTRFVRTKYMREGIIDNYLFKY